ncbi:MAG: DUF1499 domain-containing protein [Pirellulaceae bacterium]|nr:DUF1499 domain-containing protein [Pirellulaceae bacterium]
MNAQSSSPLPDCPDKPNCVCTQATRPEQAMAPLCFSGSAAEAIEQVVRQMEKLPRVGIIERRENYLHAVVSSLVFRFKDDVEFYADEQSGLLHFRSASRLGYSDMGANRRRMERLSELLILKLKNG